MPLCSDTLTTTKMAKTIATFLPAALFLAALVRADKELPRELRDPSMFCEGCFGTISEVSAMMEEAAAAEKDSELNARIDKVLGRVCHTDNLRKYVFSPPKMVKVKKTSYSLGKTLLSPLKGFSRISLFRKVCSAIVKTFGADLTSLLREEFRGGRAVDKARLVEKFCRGASGAGACADREIPSEARQKKEL